MPNDKFPGASLVLTSQLTIILIARFLDVTNQTRTDVNYFNFCDGAIFQLRVLYIRSLSSQSSVSMYMRNNRDVPTFK